MLATDRFILRHSYPPQLICLTFFRPRPSEKTAPKIIFALLATAARKKRRKAKHFSENLMSIFQAEST